MIRRYGPVGLLAARRACDDVTRGNVERTMTSQNGPAIAAEIQPRTTAPRLLAAYQRAEKLPLGTKILSQGVRFAAPYFRTIPATIDELTTGRVTGRMRHTRWVRNHLGGVHAIALCNLAELLMGANAEATIPVTHRWIPKRMSVEYLARAGGTMHAVSVLDLPADLADRTDGVDIPVEVSVTDDAGVEVFTATIGIWVTPKPATPTKPARR
ncbi:MAG: acyl-coenzyme A thioesterase PaaI-like protein [Nitriliruptoraceae bacterium]|jgi:acyl-coenzyme A thioesterase PaaI-like protein